MSAMRKGMGASSLTGFPEGLFSGASGFLRRDSPYTGLKKAACAGVEVRELSIPNF